jgi:ankyrin repeat protein
MGWRDESRPSILPIPEDVGVVSVLVEHGAAINARDKNGDTALTLSAWAPGTSNDGVFDYLVDHGADISAKDDFQQDAWLRSSADEHRMAVLLAHGQDVNERGYLGETQLFHVILACNPGRVRFLLNHGASVNVRDHAGASPLGYARQFQNILAAGNGGHRPAVMRRCAEVIQILTNAGAHDSDPGKR